MSLEYTLGASLRTKVSELEKLKIERQQVEKDLKQSLEKLQRRMKGTIYAMALAVEMRDTYVAGHQRNVAHLTRAIAKEMNLPSDQSEGIFLASAVHDIGRTAIPIEILGKPSRLTDLEFLMVKRYPQVGHDILKIVEFPWQSLRLCFSTTKGWMDLGIPGASWGILSYLKPGLWQWGMWLKLWLLIVLTGQHTA